MKTFWAVVIIVVVILLGWYFYSVSTPPQPATSINNNVTTPTPPGNDLGINGSSGQSNTGQQSAPTLLNTSNSNKLGTFLTDANGMTLYKYTKDTPGVSKCTGQCAIIWPPYTVSATEPLLSASGVTGQLGTLTRADGSTQLTYNGTPLYYYQKDKKAGDTLGQGVQGIWFVVKP